jgi:hypothetical protein
VANWESVIHKIVRSNEGNLIGNSDTIDENSILVSTEGGRTSYKIPKYIVQGLTVMKCHLTYKKQSWRGSKVASAKALEK